MEQKELDNFYLNKSTYQNRWFMYSFTVWLNTGAWYCFDHPAALHNTLKTHFEDIIDEKYFEIYFNGLYSVYAFANIFLPFISGELRDSIGDRIVLVLLSCLIVIGQVIFSYGILWKSFAVMYLGRIILGWGIESMLPTSTSFISPFFKNDHLSFTITLNQLFATFGSVLCMWYCPILAEEYGVFTAVMSGFVLNLFSAYCSIICFFFDNHAEQIIKAQPKGMYRHVFHDESEISQKQHTSFFRRAFNLSALFQQNRLYWFMTIFMALVYTSTLSVCNVSVGLLTERWFVDDPRGEIKAGGLVGFVWLTTGCVSPVIGHLIDKYGYRGRINILTGIMVTCTHYLIWNVSPLWGFIVLGLAYGLAYASVWTAIIYVISPEAYGKGYACIVSLQNLGLSIVPLVVGILRSHFLDYYYALILLAFLGLISLFFAILIYFEDKRQNYIMDGLKIEFQNTVGEQESQIVM